MIHDPLHVDSEPWPEPVEPKSHTWVGWLAAFWAVLASTVFVVVFRRLRRA